MTGARENAPLGLDKPLVVKDLINLRGRWAMASRLLYAKVSKLAALLPEGAPVCRMGNETSRWVPKELLP